MSARARIGVPFQDMPEEINPVKSCHTGDIMDLPGAFAHRATHNQSQDQHRSFNVPISYLISAAAALNDSRTSKLPVSSLRCENVLM